MKTVILFLFLLNLPLSLALANGAGILGRQAPEFNDLEWKSAKGKKITIPSVAEHKGKVIILKFWQSWCPGCLSRGLPTLKKLQNRFEGDERVKIYSAQTVFEGFGTNDKRKIISIRKRYDLTIPIAHDDGLTHKKKRSVLMTRFRSGGTPWFVIIDTNGKVVFNNFHLNFDKTVLYIEKVLLKGR
ncbi:MAG: TlpA family protein disulfide reductase [Bdellovibrionales bacterium]|jgi:thiol-disulfide isomerase/thioredoxin|nr:TlpA family protein disulfide reductase [Bdellovibrionales bacterium]MBT7669003.1 TlpA family protein disulfide reductase [Bdellovibrionales bacterium]MBT7767144.1 TlpA family protein disulfide reductase [Bdellovibrionales bacterium]